MKKRIITLLVIGTIGIMTGFSQRLSYAWNPQENKFETVNSYSERPLLSEKALPHHFNEAKIPGKRMRNLGRALAIPGAALLITGIAMMSTTDTYTYSSSSSTTTSRSSNSNYGSSSSSSSSSSNQSGTHTEGSLVGALGATSAVLGAGMTVTGTIFWIKGSKKMKKYKAENPN